MKIQVEFDDGAIAEWRNISIESERDILSALRVDEEAIKRAIRPSGIYSVNTSACLCRSFRTDIRNDTCPECGHQTHNTRVHCGALR